MHAKLQDFKMSEKYEQKNMSVRSMNTEEQKNQNSMKNNTGKSK